MIIQLVSFRQNALSKMKRNLTIQLFNESSSDIILFPGHTIDTVPDLEILSSNLKNKNTTAFLELKDAGARDVTNWSFKIENNKLLNTHSSQQFATSDEVNGNNFVVENLLHEIKNNRLHIVNKLKVCLLICGELNILTNFQSENNRVDIRTDKKELHTEFKKIFNSVDIFLNPLHSPMGNQGKMSKRRIFLSKNSRSYFSTANLDRKGVSYEISFTNSKALQYALFNGREISETKSENVTPDFISREFEILL